MIRASVPEMVAIMFSRHRTRAILDHYDITSEKNLEEEEEEEEEEVQA